MQKPVKTSTFSEYFENMLAKTCFLYIHDTVADCIKQHGGSIGVRELSEKEIITQSLKGALGNLRTMVLPKYQNQSKIILKLPKVHF